MDENRNVCCFLKMQHNQSKTKSRVGFLLYEERKASKVRLEDSRETDPSWREKFCSLFVKKEQNKERKWKNPEMFCMLCPRRGLHQSCLEHLSHWQQNLSPHLTSSWENPANERLWIKNRATYSLFSSIIGVCREEFGEWVYTSKSNINVI